MAIVPYLAITAAEMQASEPLSSPIAWMACHFSPYGTALSNLPKSLPKGSLLILNDRTPVFGHDPERIACQLADAVESLECDGILLDLQRPGEEQARAIAAAVAALPCPVAVTPEYADGLPCDVFLPAPPLNVPLGTYLERWRGREIWLEIAVEEAIFRVDGQGCKRIAGAPLPCPHRDDQLYCCYGMEVQENHIDFYLRRDAEHLQAMMEAAAGLGVQRFVGLYQQLSGMLEI